jgi:hypothetical protein
MTSHLKDRHRPCIPQDRPARRPQPRPSSCLRLTQRSRSCPSLDETSQDLPSQGENDPAFRHAPATTRNEEELDDGQCDGEFEIVEDDLAGIRGDGRGCVPQGTEKDEFDCRGRREWGLKESAEVRR